MTKKYKVLIAGISALILTVGIARFAYTPFLPLMLDQTELTTFSGGWLATFNYVGYLLAVLLISQINNLQFKFNFYRLNLIIAVISTVGMGLTTNIALWGILRLIAGISSTAGIILAAGFVMSWLKQHQFKAQLGLHFSGLGLGIAIPGILIALMNHHFDWASQWIIMGLFGLCFFVPAWLWMPAPDKTHKQMPMHHKSASRRWMQLMVGAYFCAGVGYVISATFIVAILEGMPALNGKEDWIWVLLGIAAVPSCLMWDWISLKTGEVTALILSFMILLISIMIPALSDSLLINLIGALLFGATFAGIVSLMLVFIGHKFPANPAKAMAKLTISYGIAQITAPAIAAYISTITHTYTSALWLAAASVFVGIILLLFIYQEESRIAA
ncbi:YbfB/YjiJ family MFS transporter [Methylophaga sp.]|uniref:YbfB/YjiJ family MFS transporter n=1 Tax=Methylophaga sp. TaxID=2024840 RepID=UPI003F69B0DF